MRKLVAAIFLGITLTGCYVTAYDDPYYIERPGYVYVDGVWVTHDWYYHHYGHYPHYYRGHYYHYRHR